MIYFELQNRVKQFTHLRARLATGLLYPLLDLILIAPSAIILVSLRKDYQQSIPWLLSSLSLL